MDMRVTKTHPIPEAALDDRIGWIGTSGSGKTYNAGGGVERLLASGARVVIVDPLGVWWGLRLLADGKTASPFNVAILGGPHGDPSGLTEAQWATAAGYKRSGGTWGTYKSRLRGAGLIEARDGRWYATNEGACAAGSVELPPSPGPDLVRWWAAKLPGTTKVAEALIESYPDWLSRDDLAERVEMSASGGSFGTYLSRLAGPGLIERTSEGVRLADEVMVGA